MRILDGLCAREIQNRLHSPLRVEYLDVTGSTNTELRAIAQEGEPEGLLLAAGAQSAGRGRLGRSFFSPDGSGVYFSLLLRPELELEDAVLLTAGAAVAVCRGILAVSGRSCGIKWVNDVLLDGRKVCGILTESVISPETGRLDYAVLGIGINVTVPEGGYPKGLDDVAGSVFGVSAPEMARARLVAACADEFWGIYGSLTERAFLDEYRRRSLVLGRGVTVHSREGAYPALATGIDEGCHLIVRRGGGEEEVLSSGEVSVRL